MQKSSYSIFLADDDAEDRQFFEEALEEIHPECTFTSFDNGVVLMDNLYKEEEKLPDIIFLDLNMPMLNGYECLSDIRAEPKLQKIPVVIYSTQVNPIKIDLLKKNGANLYLQKPVSFQQLKVAIKRCIDLVMDTGKTLTDADFVVRVF